MGWCSYQSRQRQGKPPEDQQQSCRMLPLAVLWTAGARAGPVAHISDRYADDYFASRPRGAQIGAHASAQSSIIPDRAALMERIREFEERFGSGPIPHPEHWSGLHLTPDEIEFWEDGTAVFTTGSCLRAKRENMAGLFIGCHRSCNSRLSHSAPNLTSPTPLVASVPIRLRGSGCGTCYPNLPDLGSLQLIMPLECAGIFGRELVV